MEKMTLREVCEKVGVTRRTVQGYEQEGLVTSAGKNKYGYLLYDEIAVARIQDIKMYQDFGFKRKEMKILFEASRERYIEMMWERLKKMKKQMWELEKNIEKMEKMIAVSKEK